MHIPQIDISGFTSNDPAAREAVVKQWAAAFETIGFATIVGHGIPDLLIEDLHREAHQFFDLPLEAKMKSCPLGKFDTQGYIGVGVVTLAKTLDRNAAPTPADYNEKISFNYIDWERDGTGNELDQEIFRPNVWPEEPPHLRPLVNEYFNQVRALAKTLMRLSASALDLPEDYFAPHYARMTTQLALVEYPDQDPPPEPGQVRSGAHVDYLGLTILRQDDAPGGLQVKLPDGEWLDVKPVRGSFVINAGELLARWTNGRWKSNIHRVVNPPTDLGHSARRLSLVFFTGPNHDTIIEALPSCITDEKPASQEPIRAWDHFMEKVRAGRVEKQ